jgi:hypothetical protein
MKNIASLLIILSFCKAATSQGIDLHYKKLRSILEENNYRESRNDLWSNRKIDFGPFISRSVIPVFDMTLTQPQDTHLLRDSIWNFLIPNYSIINKSESEITTKYFLFGDNQFIGHLKHGVFYKNFNTDQISDRVAEVLDSLDAIAGIELTTCQYPPFVMLIISTSNLYVLDYELGKSSIVIEWASYYDEYADRIKKYLLKK